MKTIIICIVLWLVVSQVIAWMLCGKNASEDEVHEAWGAVALAIPLLIMYGTIYMYAKALKYWQRWFVYGVTHGRVWLSVDVTVDDVF